MKNIRIILLSLALLVPGGLILGQEQGSAPAAQPTQSATQSPNSTEQRDLSNAATGHEGENSKAEEEGEENVGFKQSPMVKRLGGMLGLGPAGSYWLFWSLNFGVIFAVLIWLTRSKLVVAVRERNALLRKSMEEAKKASEEANAKLADIQSRLSKLDSEVAALTTQAEADFKSEEERIRAAAEQDAKHVVEAAEQEIAAAAKNARRELKAFAADLAVGLAEKKISVDENTDQHLVRSFVDQLGKDGK